MYALLVSIYKTQHSGADFSSEDAWLLNMRWRVAQLKKSNTSCWPKQEFDYLCNWEIFWLPAHPFWTVFSFHFQVSLSFSRYEIQSLWEAFTEQPASIFSQASQVQGSISVDGPWMDSSFSLNIREDSRKQVAYQDWNMGGWVYPNLTQPKSNSKKCKSFAWLTMKTWGILICFEVVLLVSFLQECQ